MLVEPYVVHGGRVRAVRLDLDVPERIENVDLPLVRPDGEDLAGDAHARRSIRIEEILRGAAKALVKQKRLLVRVRLGLARCFLLVSARVIGGRRRGALDREGIGGRRHRTPIHHLIVQVIHTLAGHQSSRALPVRTLAPARPPGKPFSVSLSQKLSKLN